MKRPRTRPGSLAVSLLEERFLLSGLSGTWLGQDGHDLVGPSSVLGGDDVQDIHVAIAGLPAGRTIAFADIQGLGGGEWEYKGPFGPWAAALVRADGSTTADLYLEPDQVETGRPFSINVRYDDGSTDGFWVTGGAADPNLRMPSAALSVAWVGQDGHDLVGPTPSVGPDGVQDVHLVLAHLSANVGIDAVLVSGATGEAWQYGTNLQGDDNAELVRNAGDPTQADLFLNPDRDLSGQTLNVQVVYSDRKTDTATVVGGHADPALHRPAPPPVALSWGQVSAQWVGQDGQNLVGPGDVHVAIAGIPAGRSVVGATLSDGQGGSWAYQAPGHSGYFTDPTSLPMAVRTVAGSATKADLDFPPLWDESGAKLTLRLTFDDGSSTVAEFAGGSSNPGLRSALPTATTITAYPGNDLNALANAFGTVHLVAGTYALSQPLVLNHPVTITADPGATLLFTQPASADPWTAAIKINSGHTTLSGFSVRFTGPVRWNWQTNYGPAVVGSTDQFDPPTSDPREAITLSHLDLQSPPAASAWEEAPRLIRLATAGSGTVVHNMLKGGTTEFLNGPWLIADNNYEGTVPGTYSYAAFAGHNTHDLVLTDNTVQPQGPSGKTWRFLVLTVSGNDDVISGNNVVGIGPQDHDTVPSANAAEVILTEAFQLHFEGAPAAVSSDGRIVQVPALQGDAPHPGDVVAVLSGPSAGQWRRISQVINPTTYLLDQALPAGTTAISVATGFVGETFQNNTIDCRGSTVAADLDLAGNQYGTQIIGNHFLGGGQAMLIAAAPTEQPVVWGWSHAPFLGAVISGNTVQDAAQGVAITVEHGAPIKSNRGRVYLAASFTNNTFVWTSTFLASAGAAPVALTMGDGRSIDPEELIVSASRNTLRVPAGFTPAPSWLVPAANVNGQELVDQKLSLPLAGPAAPTGLQLINTGALGYVPTTRDARLEFNPVEGAVGYEYRLGNATTYTSMGNTTTFTPAGLTTGVATVFVRAIDTFGQRGPDAVITFNFLGQLQLSGTWLGQDGHDLVGPYPVAVPDGVQDIHILVSGLPVGRSISFVDIEGLGGGQWQYNGPWGPWKVGVVRDVSTTTASLYFQPSQKETGRPFAVTVRLDDGSTSSFWVTGGPATPSLRMPAALVRAQVAPVVSSLGMAGVSFERPFVAVARKPVRAAHLVLPYRHKWPAHLRQASTTRWPARASGTP